MGKRCTIAWFMFAAAVKRSTAEPRKLNRQGGAGATGAHQPVRCRAGPHQPLGRVAAPTAATSAHQRPPAPTSRSDAAILPSDFFTMKKNPTVAQLCAQAETITGKAWSFKYELLHGKRFYFIYTTFTLPYGQWHWNLVCRGDKETVSQKILAILNNQP